MKTMLLSSRHAAMRTLGYALLLGNGLMNATPVVFAADEQDEQDQELRPVVKVNPDYPVPALAGGIEGMVDLEFTVDEAGAVSDIAVLSNCTWRSDGAAKCEANPMFDEPAVAAVSRWRYAPKIENGIAVTQEGVRTTISFTLEPMEDE